MYVLVAREHARPLFVLLILPAFPSVTPRSYVWKYVLCTDPQEGLGWYLLGRCYMAAQKHELAYAAYEQAV